MFGFWYHFRESDGIELPSRVDVTCFRNSNLFQQALTTTFIQLETLQMHILKIFNPKIYTER